MDSADPPSYAEVTNLELPKIFPHPNYVNGELNVCKYCGTGLSGGKYCSHCGQLVVLTTQPISVSVQITKNKLPPISTTKQVDIDSTTSRRPDIQHKNDMAYKVGNRLVYDFEKVACCPGQVVGLDPAVQDDLPWELEHRGITKEQWKDWMVRLMENQRKAPSIVGCLCMFCVPGGIAQSILCALFCPISMDHCLKGLPCFYGDWYVGMRKWQDEVNSVLNQHDMHLKLMTYKPWQKAPKSKLHGTRIAGKDNNYEMSMMVISLTDDETEILKLESWDHGVNDGCTSGIGRLL